MGTETKVTKLDFPLATVSDVKAWYASFEKQEQMLSQITDMLNALSKKLGKTGSITKTVTKTVRNTGRTLADFDKINRLGFSHVSSTTQTTQTAYDAEAERLEQLKTAAEVLYTTLISAVRKYANTLYSLKDATTGFGKDSIISVINDICLALGMLITNMDAVSFKTSVWEALAQKIANAVKSVWDSTNVLAAPSKLLTSGAAAIHEFLGKLAEDFTGAGNSAQTASGTIKNVLENLGTVFKTALTQPANGGMKTAVNGVIATVNQMLEAVVSGINAAMGAVGKLSFKVPDWVPLLGGKTLGFQVGAIKAPQIPYLAQGAVLPANRPFLAMLGDQKHGTNIEAPLTTIQEAVALVMGEQTEALMAGLSASVGVQKEILEAVLGIHIGDSVLARAVERYEKKMAIVQGGAL